MLALVEYLAVVAYLWELLLKHGKFPGQKLNSPSFPSVQKDYHMIDDRKWHGSGVKVFLP